MRIRIFGRTKSHCDAAIVSPDTNPARYAALHAAGLVSDPTPAQRAATQRLIRRLKRELPVWAARVTAPAKEVPQ